MPDRIEVAATGRARCRACRRVIAKGEERFAEAAPNPVAEGETQHYYHVGCAAERRPKAFTALVSALDPPRSELGGWLAAAQLATTHHRLERLGALERSKSARAACRWCREPIEKGAWRVALQPIEDGRLGAWGFVHLRCAAAYTGVKPSAERLLRYSELTPEEAREITDMLAALPTPDPLPSTPGAEAPTEAQAQAPGEVEAEAHDG
ncbi:MAG TPA: hypothetical protein VFS67_04740 [Polyangiaceae bacterium]|nr:hypothetical protein [Polyangiaceae bacterium]